MQHLAQVIQRLWKGSIMKNRWKIFYSSGTFSSEDGTPKDAPFWDIQDIIQWNPVAEKKYHQNGADYYIFQDGYWMGVDLIGLVDYLGYYKDECIVKIGRTIPTDKWLEIFNQAKEDDFISAKRCLVVND